MLLDFPARVGIDPNSPAYAGLLPLAVGVELRERELPRVCGATSSSSTLSTYQRLKHDVPLPREINMA